MRGVPPYNETSAHSAARYENHEALELLIAGGADLNAVCKYGHPRAIRRLI